MCRNQMKKELRKIAYFFKNGSHFTIQNILFPHVWQRKLNNKNKKNSNWNRYGTYFRVQILKSIVKFVLNTKRFSDDYGI